MEKQEKEEFFTEMRQMVHFEVRTEVQKVVREVVPIEVEKGISAAIENNVKPFIQKEIKHAFGFMIEYFDGKFAAIFEYLDLKADKTGLIALEQRVRRLE